MPKPRSAYTCDHDTVANRLANKLGTKHRREGVDIVFKDIAWEVACTLGDLRTSVRQLKRSRTSKKYMVVPRSLTARAKKLLKSTGIGITTTSGKIIKRSRRRAR